MKIAETYSHLNGLDFLLVHKPDLWKEILSVISAGVFYRTAWRWFKDGLLNAEQMPTGTIIVHDMARRSARD